MEACSDEPKTPPRNVDASDDEPGTPPRIVGASDDEPGTPPRIVGASDDEPGNPPRIKHASDLKLKTTRGVSEKEDKCVCPPEVRNIKEPPYRPPVRRSEPRASGSRDYGKQKCKECKKRKMCERCKRRQVMKLTCPGDASIREGEYALTVERVTEMYPYKSPMEFDDDSGESLGSLEGDYDPEVIERNIQAAMADRPPRQEAIAEVIRDADWGGGRRIVSNIRGKIEVIPPLHDTSSSD